MIKRVGERLQIDIRRVHVLVKFWARFVSDVAGCHRYCFDPTLATGISDVDGVLSENYRIIVGERDGSTAESLGCERDLLRRRSIGELVPFARFGDIPVLAKSAAEIASSRAE